MESNITYLIAKQEADLVLGVNAAAYDGDLFRLKGLISEGANPSKPDYNGRTALVRERLQINHQSDYYRVHTLSEDSIQNQHDPYFFSRKFGR